MEFFANERNSELLYFEILFAFGLAKYEKHKLASNGEILSGVDPLMVAAEIGTLMRSRAKE